MLLGGGTPGWGQSLVRIAGWASGEPSPVEHPCLPCSTLTTDQARPRGHAQKMLKTKQVTFNKDKNRVVEV